MEVRKIAIISGVTSFLGVALSKKLLKEGFLVYGIVRPNSKKIKKLNLIKGINVLPLSFDNINESDISNIYHTDTNNLINNIRLSKADISFIHFGWGATLDRSNMQAQYENILYSKKVLEFAKIIGVTRFIFAGSQAELSNSAYGMAKKQFADYAENNLQNSSTKFIHLRIFSVYGKGDRDNTILMTLKRMIKMKQDMSLSKCNFKWNFLHIDDFVNIVYKLIKYDARSGIYDIASNDTRLLSDFVMEAYKVLKGKIKLNFGAIEAKNEVFSIPDITNTIYAIGEYNFISFKEGVKKL